jgi:hypothetical protein
MKRFKNLVYPGYGSFNKFTVSQVYNYQKHNVVVHGFFDTINFQDLNAFNIYDFKSFARNCKIIDKSNTEYWKSYVDNGKQFKYKSFLQFITVLNSVFDFYYISVTSNQNVTIASSTLSSFVSTKSDVGV